VCGGARGEQRTTEDKGDLCVEEHAENRGQLKTNKTQATSGVGGDREGEVPEIRRGALSICSFYLFIYLIHFEKKEEQGERE